MGVIVDQVMQEIDVLGSIMNYELMQIVFDLKEFVSLIFRGIKEVQFVVSYVGLIKKIDYVCFGGNFVFLNVFMKEVGIDFYWFDFKFLVYRMYFFLKDIVYEVLVVVLLVFIGFDDGYGKFERIMYIFMVIIIVWMIFFFKIVEFIYEGIVEQCNVNILFVNLVVILLFVDFDF